MINVGLIGVGYWGPNLAKSFELTQNATIKWLCDLNKEQLQRIANRYPDARATFDLQDIINDSSVDAVAISTPAGSHFKIALQMLEAGKHVLVEKPITVDSQQASRLTELAERKGLTLMVGHVFEYNSTIRFLKEIIRSGELGEVYYLNFERTNLGPVRTDVNALWDLATHDIYIMNFLLDATPINVTANGQSYLNPEVEDAIYATFGYEGGIMAHVSASWLNPRKVRKIIVVGSKKMAVWDDLDLNQPIQVYDKYVGLSQDIPDTFEAYKTSIVNGGVYIPHIIPNQPLQAECEHFVECIETGAKPQSDGHSGMQVVLALEAAGLSMKNQSRKVEIRKAGAELKINK